MNIRSIPSIAALVCVAGLLFAEGAHETTGGRDADSSAAAHSPSAPVLKIGVLSDVDSIPLIVAHDHGLFTAEKAPVQLVNFKSPVARDAALQAGEIDGAISDVLAAVFARQAGFDVLITSATDGSYKLVVKPGSTVQSIEGLAGKSVGISQNTIIEYCTDRMADAAGMSVDSVRKLPVSQMPVRLEMLQQGKLDAAVLPEPLASVAVAAGGRVLDSSDRLSINPGVIIFRNTAISEKADSIRSFYRAYNDAVSYLKRAPRSEYIDVLVESASFPSQASTSLVLPDYHRASAPKEREVTEVTQWLQVKGLASRIFGYGELVDSSLLP